MEKAGLFAFLSFYRSSWADTEAQSVLLRARLPLATLRPGAASPRGLAPPSGQIQVNERVREGWPLLSEQSQEGKKASTWSEVQLESRIPRNLLFKCFPESSVIRLTLSLLLFSLYHLRRPKPLLWLCWLLTTSIFLPHSRGVGLSLGFRPQIPTD